MEHKSFTALNKADDKYGHYLINANIRLLVKYSPPSNSHWQFTFNESDVKSICDDMAADGISFFGCLVCGTETVCLLTEQQLAMVIDLDTEDAQWVRVEVPSAGRSMRVRGVQQCLRILLLTTHFRMVYSKY